MREHDAEPARYLACKRLPVRDEDLACQQPGRDGAGDVGSLLFLEGGGGEEGFQVDPEEEGGVGFGGVGDGMAGEEGGGEGVVGGEAALVGADVGGREGGVGEEGGGDVVG